MIIEKAEVISTPDLVQFAWRNLRQYQNVLFVEDYLCNLHGIPKAQKPNARKQAQQLRYCLVQAEEYFDAARTVTLVTKPVLLYYSVMNLAIAEVLLKQSGDSSLDRAREHHAHHGLSLNVLSYPRNSQDLQTIGSRLIATPHVRAMGQRIGTFELWHRSSRHMPLAGSFVRFAQGATSTSYEIWGKPQDRAPPELQMSGISLMDCLCSCPGMLHALRLYGAIPKILRGMHSTKFRTGKADYELIIHPSESQILDLFYEAFKVEDPAQFQLNVLPSGLICSWSSVTGRKFPNFDIPDGCMWTKDEIRFWPGEPALNEFGNFYVSLYILGNYARYYPDHWMYNVEQSSAFSVVAETFLSLAERRAALLALSEMRRVCLITEN